MGLGGLIRKAGQQVRNFDDAYASKLADYIGSFNTVKPSAGQNAQVAAGLLAGVPATRKFAVEESNDVLRGLMEYGLPAVNAGVRYGVPLAAAGVVADAAGQLYEQASDIPIFPQGGNDENLMVTYVR